MTATTGTPAGKRPLYEASTQYKNWRYSHQSLAQLRASLNCAAVDAIRNAFEADEPGSSANVSFLSSDEEVLLVKLYLSKVVGVCNFHRFPEEVEATAVSYMKRFYLKNTVMDWHPKNVMLTAVFLATKTTNNPISLEAYVANIPGVSPSDVLDLEFLVAQSLRFEFAVWHAHRAVWGLWLDLQNLTSTPTDLAQSQGSIYDTALSYVRASRLTDAELMYTPSQIAFAALYLASPDLASQWAQAKFPPESAFSSLELLQTTSASIATLITEEGKVPDVESVRKVDRRLRLCKNPEKTKGSNAYKAKQAEEEKKAYEKRSRKADDVRKTMDEEDPFGNEIGGTARSGTLVEDDEDDD